jgi:hypothetical protein
MNQLIITLFLNKLNNNIIIFILLLTKDTRYIHHSVLLISQT